MVLVFMQSNSFHDLVFPAYEDSATMVTHNRKLKEKVVLNTKKRGNSENFNVEDYHIIDPVPSSKATIRHKPIAHGSPLMPFIPKPAPAAPPKNDGPPGGHY
ncbi:Dna-directed rna polymerase [Thalictrum thalictroides]|uniref:Dna-directed rna polymerase n=1 Tax=Thalictrum thalictroides TaxID=46969 RepID=A0A7J6V990_THATH|nr:Dna-directed rna polymerase [Thalictrum thalictroides]